MLTLEICWLYHRVRFFFQRGGGGGGGGREGGLSGVPHSAPGNYSLIKLCVLKYYSLISVNLPLGMAKSIARAGK